MGMSDDNLCKYMLDSITKKTSSKVVPDNDFLGEEDTVEKEVGIVKEEPVKEEPVKEVENNTLIPDMTVTLSENSQVVKDLLLEVRKCYGLESKEYHVVVAYIQDPDEVSTKELIQIVHGL